MGAKKQERDELRKANLNWVLHDPEYEKFRRFECHKCARTLTLSPKTDLRSPIERCACGTILSEVLAFKHRYGIVPPDAGLKKGRTPKVVQPSLLEGVGYIRCGEGRTA